MLLHGETSSSTWVSFTRHGQITYGCPIGTHNGSAQRKAKGNAFQSLTKALLVQPPPRKVEVRSTPCRCHDSHEPLQVVNQAGVRYGDVIESIVRARHPNIRHAKDYYIGGFRHWRHVDINLRSTSGWEMPKAIGSEVVRIGRSRQGHV